jgi:hypothetical protein
MNAITPQILEQFKLIVSSEYVFTDADSIDKFGENEEDLGEIISKVDGMLYGLF